LDRTATHILDLDPHTQTIRAYPGNYSDYLDQFLAERDKQWAAYKDQVYEVRRMKQDIARTREQANSVERSTTPRNPGVRAIAKKVMKKAKSREKKLERYLEADERVDKPTRSWQMKLDFAETHIGRDVLTLENLTIGYPNHPPLLHDLNQYIRAGQRVALTGPNGSGKTTLLRTIAGRLQPMAGQARLGGSVKMGYMSQEQELLDPSLTALESIRQVAPMNQTDARSFLHYFLFSDDDPLRPIPQLSYGERARLALALLVAQGCNFLLLDEPINHLDIPSRERFEQALQYFQGTVLAVVHDRYFIDRFATDVWLVNEEGLEAHILKGIDD
ncbi:MAG: ABC-F family ATP-binding cassette domain-containing protein, partial [Anaerolineales bacterium]|nr:ABC-F family ATP-binding cassette domain-containing protein [Anaerolineales bacterium]